jgi:hypothetical protein
MIIIKELKNATFEYREVDKEFTIIDKKGNKTSLNFRYAFAFVRFALRIFQKNWFRDKKCLDNFDDDVIEFEEQKQMELFNQ